MRATISALKIGPEIGNGCFGAVHECQHPVQGKIAVKLIEKGAAESNADSKQRKMDLLAEAQHLNPSFRSY